MKLTLNVQYVLKSIHFEIKSWCFLIITCFRQQIGIWLHPGLNALRLYADVCVFMCVWTCASSDVVGVDVFPSWSSLGLSIEPYFVWNWLKWGHSRIPTTVKYRKLASNVWSDSCSSGLFLGSHSWWFKPELCISDSILFRQSLCTAVQPKSKILNKKGFVEKHCQKNWPFWYQCHISSLRKFQILSSPNDHQQNFSSCFFMLLTLNFIISYFFSLFIWVCCKAKKLKKTARDIPNSTSNTVSEFLWVSTVQNSNFKIFIL